ncbi:putative clathrin assembly protein At2g25430 [Ipomoea triloba]|uniref:putative clathrin assembly protein At2g25430 n=1 Tax=Ipomoea triloba TaxID=35885 RepID=UPI00125E28B5|nr:putative clathrin assembly protein At2g25430 [Ipomoea triloba]
MQRRFRRAFTSIKEHAYVSYAKMASAGGICDLELIVVKATSPDDTPLPDRYIHHLLRIFSISPTSLRAFALFFARRFGGTRCWRVALKCLLLLHRLLRSSDAALRTELLWARAHRYITLYPCDFVDRTSTSSSGEYTIFVRSYARLIDEALDLDCFSIKEISEEEKEDEEFCYGEILFNRMKELRGILEALPRIQSLIDRVMDCRPAAAESSVLVRSAMELIVRESFASYGVFEEEVVGVLENMIQMPYRNCVAAFTIYKKAAAQAEELNEFYEWCKCMGLCGSCEYPLVGRIPQIQILALENFLNGMWGLSDSPANEEEAVGMAGKDGDECDGKEIGELIDLGCDESSVGWEELLDASITMPCMASDKEKSLTEHNNNVEWQMQLYNPIHQLQPTSPLQIGSFPPTPQGV